MTTKRKKHHNVETKLQAVLDVLENGTDVLSVSNEVGVHRDTIYKWIDNYKVRGRAGLINSRSIRKPASSEASKENRQLKKKLNEKEMEIEILKKFQAFLRENG